MTFGGRRDCRSGSLTVKTPMASLEGQAAGSSEPRPVYSPPAVAPLLTLPEVCERVRLSPWAVRRAIGRGELVAYKLAGRLRIPEYGLDDWLRARVMEPIDAAVEPTPMSRLGVSSQPAATFRERLRKEPDVERAQGQAP